jgi:hypothetical protein
VVTISPPAFTKVDYDVAELAGLFAEAMQLVPGLPPGLDVEVRIAEDRSTSAARVVQRDPWVFDVDGGAVEDTQHPRRIGRDQALVTFCRLLFEVSDRLDPAMGAPPVDATLAPTLRVAWDTYCVGRTARLGVRAHPPKYRYNLRNRVGFSDAADACFDRLWSASGLSWTELEAAVAEAAPVAP